MSCKVEVKYHGLFIFEAKRIQIFGQQVNLNDILVINLLQDVETIGDVFEQRISFSYTDICKVQIHFFLTL